MKVSFHVVLYQPEIPPNTGNIIRLCANSNTWLHLIHPLGFDIDDKQVKRAGLDYHDLAMVKEHPSFDSFLNSFDEKPRIFACSTKGKTIYSEVHFKNNDVFLFGPETRGLPTEILQRDDITDVIKIPMAVNNRSLNLSNSVAIILYEALRQNNAWKENAIIS